MAKSNLKLSDHLIYSEEKIVEVWHEGELVASVYGADGPGIRIITKYPYDIIRGGIEETSSVVESLMTKYPYDVVRGRIGEPPNVIEIRIEAE